MKIDNKGIEYEWGSRAKRLRRDKEIKEMWIAKKRKFIIEYFPKLEETKSSSCQKTKTTKQ